MDANGYLRPSQVFSSISRSSTGVKDESWGDFRYRQSIGHYYNSIGYIWNYDYTRYDGYDYNKSDYSFTVFDILPLNDNLIHYFYIDKVSFTTPDICYEETCDGYDYYYNNYYYTELLYTTRNE